MMEPTLSAHRLMFSDITDALRTGQIVFRAIPAASCAFAAVLAGFGMALLSAITALGFSPMALPFAGGFMLVGPILLTGFFELSRRHAIGQKPTLGMPSVPFGGHRTDSGWLPRCVPSYSLSGSLMPAFSTASRSAARSRLSAQTGFPHFATMRGPFTSGVL